ncbi:hypothetical protein ADK43_12510 [Streptomyces rimosus subsp. rimosus]|nr:hypothetical protein ADK43_12510 [Streptomyces rimosus subsp. rimosus]
MRLRPVGGQLLLAGPSPAAHRLITRTGTGPLIQALPGTAAAVRFLARDGRTWRDVGPAEEEPTLFTACRNMPDDRVARLLSSQAPSPGLGSARDKASQAGRAAAYHPLRLDTSRGRPMDRATGTRP